MQESLPNSAFSPLKSPLRFPLPTNTSLRYSPKHRVKKQYKMLFLTAKLQQ
ncbi:hypothetical protein ACS0TY_023646 [Phlomoides rotata]